MTLDQYPPWVGLVYVFNLIVGTGALTLPAAFAAAGWLFSSIALLVLCFVSFITVTFVIESIACANATLQWKRIQSHRIDESEETLCSDPDDDDVDDGHEENAILINRVQHLFNLNKKVELGEIASLYLNRAGHIFFFASICIYLFGDLTIYAAASGKTMVDLTCKSSNNSENYTETCWENFQITKINMYRIFVALFGLFIGPFTYFNVQKTKYLQLFTISIRWFAYSIMLTLSIIRLIKYGAQGHPAVVNLMEVPALAGSSVYSFMCHHSLPSLIVPISNKTHLTRKISFDFIVICAFYLLVSLTASFAFDSINVLYSLNFIQTENSTLIMKLFGIFLAAFPLFPMSASFPIIAITLQANLKNLFVKQPNERHGFFVKRLMFPSLAFFPPIILALSTHNLKTLIEITGSYAGVIVQYIIPAVLVIAARNRCLKDFRFNYNHKYCSPFKQYGWFLFVIIWAGICIVFVTFDLVKSNTNLQ